MTQPRLDLKNRYLAALLAFLLPGAGHFYQRRFFKAAVYGICILGTFFYGLALGNWQVVFYRGDAANRTYGYYAQFWVGLPALPALLQYQRFDPTAGLQRELDEPVEGVPFEGAIVEEGEGGGKFADVTGRLTLETSGTPFGAVVRGRFEGTVTREGDDAGRQVTLNLAENFRIAPPVGGAQGRLMRIGIPEADEQLPEIAAQAPAGMRIDDIEIEGTIPRKLGNWYQAPLDERELEDLHGSLGRLYELAAVFTWIAGLLNILAIWDALEGPAYGMGDEVPSSESGSPADSSGASTPAAADNAAPPASPAATAAAPRS